MYYGHGMTPDTLGGMGMLTCDALVRIAKDASARTCKRVNMPGAWCSKYAALNETASKVMMRQSQCSQCKRKSKKASPTTLHAGQALREQHKISKQANPLAGDRAQTGCVRT